MMFSMPCNRFYRDCDTLKYVRDQPLSTTSRARSRHFTKASRIEDIPSVGLSDWSDYHEGNEVEYDVSDLIHVDLRIVALPNVHSDSITGSTDSTVSSKTIFVCGLAPESTIKMVADILSPYGAIDSIRMSPSLSGAFAQFRNTDEAIQAQQLVANARLVPNDDPTIVSSGVGSGRSLLEIVDGVISTKVFHF